MKAYESYKPSGVAWLGDVPSNWEIKQIRYLSTFVKTGGTPSAEAFVDEPQLNGLPWYSPSDIKDGRLSQEPSRMVSAEFISEISLFPEGTILLVGIGDVGRVALTKCSATGNQQLNFIGLEESLVPEFVRYSLEISQDFTMSRANKTLLPILNQEQTKRLRLPVPLKSEQQSIVNYLDVETARIDGLIEAKYELIKLLVEYRQSVISDAVLKGIDPDVLLKPSGVDWLGEVPAHWDVKRARFVAKTNPSPSKDITDISTVSFLPMEAIGEDGSLQLDQIKALYEVSSGYTFFENGDVTIAKITPCFENGKGAHMQGLHNEVGFGTTELIVIRPLEQVTADYLYLLTQTHSFRKIGESTMLGSGGQKRVSDSFVKDFKIAWPPLDEQVSISNFLKVQLTKFDELLKHSEAEIDLLKELRASTIADAILGRVKVI